MSTTPLPEQTAERKYGRIVKVLNEMQDENLKLRDVVLLEKFNKTILENVALKKQVETKDLKMQELMAENTLRKQ